MNISRLLIQSLLEQLSERTFQTFIKPDLKFEALLA